MVLHISVSYCPLAPVESQYNQFDTVRAICKSNKAQSDPPTQATQAQATSH